MLDIITIIANILLGMNIIGTLACVLLFIIVTISKSYLLRNVLSKVCILFIITWFLNISCNVFILIKAS
ncbi:hypothetical protein [Clostridium sp. JNZ J1-5]